MLKQRKQRVNFRTCNRVVTCDGQLFTWGQARTSEGQLVALNKPKHINLGGTVVGASMSNKNNIAVMDDCKVFQWDEGRGADRCHIYAY